VTRYEGAALGRPASLTTAQQKAAREALAAGASVSEVARQYGTSRQTIMRVRDALVEAA
jgi:putative DNA-invertase from lambdoid prophage Rac